MDRGTPRGEREDFARRLRAFYPRRKCRSFTTSYGAIEDVLRLLSNDFWHIELRQQEGATEGFQKAPAEGQVLLFSGGLDSLAGAIEFRTRAARTCQPHNAWTTDAKCSGASSGFTY